MSVAEASVKGASARGELGAGRSTAPSRSREETRRRLLDAGTELFAAEGLHAVSSARIARRAGVASGTFYLHFEDKRQLFRQIAFDALAALRARQDAAARRAAGDPVAEFRARIHELVAVAEEQGPLMRLLFGRGHEAGEVGEELIDALLPGLEERLRQRAAAGELRSGVHPAVAAQALAAMTTRVVAWYADDPSRCRREELVDTLLGMHPVFGAARSGAPSP